MYNFVSTLLITDRLVLPEAASLAAGPCLVRVYFFKEFPLSFKRNKHITNMGREGKNIISIKDLFAIFAD